MTGMTGKPSKVANTRIRLRVCVAAAALTLAASPQVSSQEAACVQTGSSAFAAFASSPVETSRAVRILQTEMMVAGLACGEKQKYDAFATRYRSTLVSNGDRLKKYFYARDGANRGFEMLNSFVTRVANETSGRIASTGTGYCAVAMRRFGELLSADIVDLERYSVDHALQIGAFDPPIPAIVHVAASEDGCGDAPEKVARTRE